MALTDREKDKIRCLNILNMEELRTFADEAGTTELNLILCLQEALDSKIENQAFEKSIIKKISGNPKKLSESEETLIFRILTIRSIVCNRRIESSYLDMGIWWCDLAYDDEPNPFSDSRLPEVSEYVRGYLTSIVNRMTRDYRRHTVTPPAPDPSPAPVENTVWQKIKLFFKGMAAVATEPKDFVTGKTIRRNIKEGNTAALAGNIVSIVLVALLVAAGLVAGGVALFTPAAPVVVGGAAAGKLASVGVSTAIATMGVSATEVVVATTVVATAVGVLGHELYKMLHAPEGPSAMLEHCKGMIPTSVLREELPYLQRLTETELQDSLHQIIVLMNTEEAAPSPLFVEWSTQERKRMQRMREHADKSDVPVESHRQRIAVGDMCSVVGLLGTHSRLPKVSKAIEIERDPEDSLVEGMSLRL